MNRLFFFALLVLPIYLTGQDKNTLSNTDIDNIFLNKKEIYFAFTVSGIDEINNLTKFISIDNIQRELVFAYANKDQFANFISLGYTWELLPSPSEHFIPNMNGDGLSVKTKAWNYYPTYDAYDSIMKKFESDYPSICKFYNIGTLASGREILAVKISDNVNVRELEPQFFYTSSMHGDELVGYILMLRLIDYLLSNYGVDPRVTKLVNNIEIWINPNANPDGTYNSGNHTVFGATRTNASGVDLNRNFPDPQDGPHPDGNQWQSETVYFMDFADSLDFVMSANIHSGSELVNYPWDTWPQLHADDDWWFAISREYADTAHINSPAGYLNDMNNGITNGYEWYQINGGRQDYMNYFKHCREFTLELSNIKVLPEAQLEDYWYYNYRSLLNYLEQVMYGIRGVVTDSCTNQPLKAKVFVNNHDFDESYVFSSLPLGNYYRPIYAGTYSLTFSAPGYQDKTINNVFVVADDTTILNVVLQPLAPIAAFEASDTVSCNGVVEFYDQSIAPNGTYYEWDFGDGSTSNLNDPVHSYLNNGSYTVKLKLISLCTGVDSLIKTNYILINKPSAPLVNDIYHCGQDSFLLYASGSGLMEWWDSPIGGNLIDTGNYHQTQLLDSTKTYYIQNVVPFPIQNTGKYDNSGTGIYYNNSTSHFLVFNAYEEMVLESVKVYADGDGYRNIELRDSNGNVLQSKNVYITGGESRILLNFNVPIETDLQLAGPSAPYLFRNNSGLSYPYEIPGLISITGSSAGSNPTGYYYYFYDWEIRKASCTSNRVPLKVKINQGPPVADFDFTINGSIIFFHSSSIDANEYFWDFGDGDTSVLSSPKHEYLSTGPYNVKLIVSNTCGTDTVAKLLVITGLLENNIDNRFQLLPNPSNGNVLLYLDIEKGERYKILVINCLGEIVFSQNMYFSSGDNSEHLDLSQLNKGIYFVILNSRSRTISRKLILN